MYKYVNIFTIEGYIHVHVRVCARLYIYMNVCTYIHLHTYVNIRMYMYTINIYECMHV